MTLPIFPNKIQNSNPSLWRNDTLLPSVYSQT
uniref:Uncharacterized protein n=1 Tax=Anguilla anguilla TaxID=7936 RepID=A0A0E9U8X1_ANGAN